MTERRVDNIFLIGFSATGKSLVAREVANRLNWSPIDSDDEIAKVSGKTIPEIFEQQGESAFRELERQVIAKACQQKQAVIATGGGAILDPVNRSLLIESGVAICLEAKAETIYHRLLEDTVYSSNPVVRPLLSGNKPLERIKQLKSSRQSYYAMADWTVHTDNLAVSEVAEEVIRGWRCVSCYWEDKSQPDLVCKVRTASECYPIYAGWGLLDTLGEKMRQLGLSGVANLIGDETVFSIYGNRVIKVLEGAGFKVNSFVVPPGEMTKSMDHAVRIYDFLVEHRVERDDVIIALGGGMVGDLAGFVAATFLRGLPWLQIPTSLVAMVDASIGGKVAVNHPRGKNLIGAFYQPCLVLADVQTLTTLPQRELTSGWAEVIKYGLILDREFFSFLEANVHKLVKLAPDVVSKAIIRSASIKARLVSEDEKERGRRIILNYGHTIAHGLESATHYERFLHGEAVAIGMTGAARLSQRLELLPAEAARRQQELICRFGLPVSCTGVDVTAVLRAMELDKKVKGKEIRWVLLDDIGKGTVKKDVPREVVSTVIESLLKDS